MKVEKTKNDDTSAELRIEFLGMMRDTYVHGPIWLKRHRKTVEENATEAKVIVMYERVMRHMESVVKTQDNTTHY